MTSYSFKGKRLLVIGAGPVQTEGIRKAMSLGCHVTAIDGNAAAPGLSIASEGHAIDFSKTDQVLALADRIRVDAVATFSCDASLHAVAEVVERFRLPGLTHAQVDLALNKYHMRKHCAANGIPVPIFAPTHSAEECLEACATAQYPCVVKPMDSSGSRGVTLVKTAAEVAPAYARAKANSHSAVLVESFMSGVESSVEGFVLASGAKIVTMSDKIRTPPPYLLDTDVIFPTKYEGELLTAIKDMALKIMNTSGVNPTPFHMEVMITPDGPRLVEVGLRGPGFKVFSHIIPRVSGVDVLALNIACAFGADADFEPRDVCASVIKFIPGIDGVVTSIAGVDKARRVPGVEEVELYVKPGDKTRPLTSGSDRVGHIIVFAESRAAAVAAADEAAALVKLSYEEDV